MPDYKVGDQVLLNGWGVGEGHWGGLAQKARLNGDWLIPLPKAFTAAQAMAIGTAGYTAMLCILALEHNGVTPGQGEILVTGANGGVGSFAIALLSRLGYRVVASTGRTSEHDYLKQLGASEIIDRATLSEPGKPLAKERWAAVIDSVGSHTLANACASTQANGTVAACGSGPGHGLSRLRCAVHLARRDPGRHQQRDPAQSQAVEAWSRLARDLDFHLLPLISHEIGLSEAIEAAPRLLAGQLRGRVVVDVNR